MRESLGPRRRRANTNLLSLAPISLHMPPAPMAHAHAHEVVELPQWFGRQTFHADGDVASASPAAVPAPSRRWRVVEARSEAGRHAVAAPFGVAEQSLACARLPTLPTKPTMTAQNALENASGVASLSKRSTSKIHLRYLRGLCSAPARRRAGAQHSSARLLWRA